MINILVCDDNALFLKKIIDVVNKNLRNNPLLQDDYNIVSFGNSEKSLDYIKKTPPDISLLDIDMPKINGFDLANRLHLANPDSFVIFISNYDRLVYTSIKYKPFRFIRKEHLSAELSEALLAIVDELTVNCKYIELSNNCYNEAVYISNIVSIESQRNYVRLNCVDKKIYLYRSTVKQMENELKEYGFVRIHAAFIVNMKYIEKYSSDYVIMNDATQYKISKKYQNEIKYHFLENVK